MSLHQYLKPVNKLSVYVADNNATYLISRQENKIFFEMDSSVEFH